MNMKAKTKDRLLTGVAVVLICSVGFCTSGCASYRQLSTTEKWMLVASIAATGAITAHELDKGNTSPITQPPESATDLRPVK